MLLDHEEVPLPGRLTRRVVSAGVDQDAAPAALGDQRGLVLEPLGLHRDRETGGERLAVEFRVGGRVDPPVDHGRLADTGLLRREVAGEPGQGHRVAVRPPAGDREPDAVGVAGLEHAAGDEDGLAGGRAVDLGAIDLGVVDGDGQLVAVVGRLGVAVQLGQGRERGPLGLGGLPADVAEAAVGQEPLGGGLEVGRAGRTRA